VVYSREPKGFITYGLNCIAVGHFFSSNDFGGHRLVALRVTSCLDFFTF
jgi:hypothetical protein